MTLNTQLDIRSGSSIDIPKEILRSEELQVYMDRAYRQTMRKVGRGVKDTFRITDETQTVFYLSFNQICSVTKLIINGELVSSAKYTVDKSTGSVTLLATITTYIDDLMEIEFIPQLYQDVERMLVEIDILVHKNIISDSDTKRAKINDLRAALKELLKDSAKSQTVVMGMNNHPSSAHFDQDNYIYG